MESRKTRRYRPLLPRTMKSLITTRFIASTLIALIPLTALAQGGTSSAGKAAKFPLTGDFDPPKHTQIRIIDDGPSVREYRTAPQAPGTQVPAMQEIRKRTNAVRFPGRVSELKSPNGLYSVRNIDKSIGNIPKNKYSLLAGNDTTIDGHYLLFLQKNRKETVVLKSYCRDVDILWSPDSSAFIVNDYVGSNLTVPYLYRVHDLSHPVDVGAKFIDSLKEPADKSNLAGSIYTHIIAARWTGSHSVEIKAVGNSPSPGGKTYSPFTLIYSWNLENTFNRIKSAPQSDFSSDVPE
jgi:hypothetical protein